MENVRVTISDVPWEDRNMARLDRRIVALALTCGLLVALALPTLAAAPPAGATPSAASPADPGGLGALFAGWLHELLGERDPSPPDKDGDVLGKRTGPAGPLIDPNGSKPPQDPGPRGDHGPRR